MLNQPLSSRAPSLVGTAVPTPDRHDKGGQKMTEEGQGYGSPEWEQEPLGEVPPICQ